MNTKLEYTVQELRLQYWDRILQGEHIDSHVLDSEFLTITRAGGFDDKKAFVLLRSCATIAVTGSDSMKLNLKAAMLTWFSGESSNEYAQTVCITNRHMPHIYEVAGAKLSWRDAARITGINPDDYSAKHRVLRLLRSECESQWLSLFGEGRRGPFEVARASA